MNTTPSLPLPSNRQFYHRAVRLRRRQVLLLVHLCRLLLLLLRNIDWTELTAADRKRLRTALTRLESETLLARTACSAPNLQERIVGTVRTQGEPVRRSGATNTADKETVLN